MASIIESLAISGSRKADGSVNAGGRVFLTRPGSANSAVTAYQDRDASSSHPLNAGGTLLDSGGRAAIYIQEPCNVRIEDTTGVTVSAFTIEPSISAQVVEVISPGFTGLNDVGALVANERTYLQAVLASLYASTGGLDGKYRGTYGTADTNVKDEIERIGLTPQRFGAKGDGVTDDSSAFLQLAAAQAASGLPIFIPRGTYQLSQAFAPTGGAIIRGAGPTSILRGTNGAMDCVSMSTSLGSSISDLAISHATSSTGTGLSLGPGGSSIAFVHNVQVSGYAKGLKATFGTVFAVASSFNGSTNSVDAGTFPVYLEQCILTGVTTFTGAGSVRFIPSSYAATFDMANGGSTTPIVTQGINYVRVRGTSAAGTGAIAATAAPVGSQAHFLTLDMFANGAGTFTFNLNAQYHGPLATTGAIPNGQRMVWTYAWNPTESIWVAQSQTAAFA